MALKVIYNNSLGTKQIGPLSEAIENLASSSLDYYSRGAEREASLAIEMARKNSLAIEKIVEYINSQANTEAKSCNYMIKSILTAIGATGIDHSNSISED